MEEDLRRSLSVLSLKLTKMNGGSLTPSHSQSPTSSVSGPATPIHGQPGVGAGQSLTGVLNGMLGSNFGHSRKNSEEDGNYISDANGVSNDPDNESDSVDKSALATPDLGAEPGRLAELPRPELPRRYSQDTVVSHTKRNSCMVHNTLNLDLIRQSGLPRSLLADGPDLDPELARRDSVINGMTASEFYEEEDDDDEQDDDTMSKDSLADMVVSIRDLSRSLSSLSMKIRPRNILVVTKIHDQDLVPLTRDLVLWMLSLDTTQHGAFSVFVQNLIYEHPRFQNEELLKYLEKEGSAAYGPPNEACHASTALGTSLGSSLGSSTSVSPARKRRRLRCWSEDGKCGENPNMYDLVLTLGGDGTVLYSSWLFQRVVPPVVCFSLGSLGFMTGFDSNKYKETILSILQNGFHCSLRMRFECTVMQAIDRGTKGYGDIAREIAAAEKNGMFATHRPMGTYSILNDVVVDRGPNPNITTTELYGDYSFLTSMEADGCVISTPSGSTAYSLSAGGSLVHPDIPGVLVSPICPHTLSFRPLVLPDSLMIRIAVPYDSRTSAWCSFDGRSRVELGQGDFLTVSASRYPFPMVQNGNTSIGWFNRLSETLHWNDRRRQKAFT